MLCQYAEFRYTEYRVLFIIVLNVMLNVIMLNVIMLNVIMLNVIMLSVVMLTAKVGESSVVPLCCRLWLSQLKKIQNSSKIKFQRKIFESFQIANIKYQK
jgi:hypothetical protein